MTEKDKRPVNIEHGQGEKKKLLKMKKIGQSESRCGVKTGKRQRQRLTNGQREMTNA